MRRMKSNEDDALNTRCLYIDKVTMEFIVFLAANLDVTQKSFAFPLKHNIPLYYVSASDGTNVVKVRSAFLCVLSKKLKSILSVIFIILNYHAHGK